MTIERKSADCLIGESPEAVARFIESDFLIRSGMCPNGHGLLQEDGALQRCPRCGFWTNTRAEKEIQ